jgi:2-keto-4-pentenoate hydratase
MSDLVIEAEPKTRSSPEAQLADALWVADIERKAIRPLRAMAAELGVQTTQENAYAIQQNVRQRRTAGGDRVVGRKIGLTAVAVQRQLGVDQPDYGALWSSTAFGDGATVSLATLIHPKIEAEVAIVLERDLTDGDLTVADVIRATAYALPALEIVDSRIQGWDIKLFDTISDNASAAGFVLGADPKRLDQIELRDAAMILTEDGREISRGIGSDCLGHPLNAAAWLARQCASLGDPLRAGDIILTGALGPMVTIRPACRYEANIAGLGRVAASFA